MRKIAIYHLLNAFVLLVYGTLLLLQYYLTIFSLPLSLIWCPLLLIMEGCVMIMKALLFHSRTSLWFGLVLFLWGVNFLFIEYMHYPMVSLLPACLFSVAIVGLLLALCYQDGIQLGIGITSLLVGVPFVFYVLNAIPLWLTLLLSGGIFIICLFFSRLIPKMWVKV